MDVESCWALGTAELQQLLLLLPSTAGIVGKWERGLEVERNGTARASAPVCWVLLCAGGATCWHMVAVFGLQSVLLLATPLAAHRVWAGPAAAHCSQWLWGDGSCHTHMLEARFSFTLWALLLGLCFSPQILFSHQSPCLGVSWDLI